MTHSCRHNFLKKAAYNTEYKQSCNKVCQVWEAPIHSRNMFNLPSHPDVKTFVHTGANYCNANKVRTITAMKLASKSLMALGGASPLGVGCPETLGIGGFVLGGVGTEWLEVGDLVLGGVGTEWLEVGGLVLGGVGTGKQK